MPRVFETGYSIPTSASNINQGLINKSVTTQTTNWRLKVTKKYSLRIMTSWKSGDTHLFLIWQKIKSNAKQQSSLIHRFPQEMKTAKWQPALQGTSTICTITGCSHVSVGLRSGRKHKGESLRLPNTLYRGLL